MIQTAEEPPPDQESGSGSSAVMAYRYLHSVGFSIRVAARNLWL